MLHVQKNIIALLVLLLLPLSSMAAVVSGEIFAVDGDGAGGSNDLSISWVEFSAAASGQVTIDITAGFDSQIMLLQGGAELDSSYYGDSLSYNVLAGNDYLIAIGQVLFFDNHAVNGFQDIAFLSGTGEWSVTISDNVQIISEVPVPAALPLFFSALMGLVAIRRKQA
ncbi:VPLPA-CTERM sorting domain-containing protein [Oceanicoccus sp. KOV_DT_Chl]|uniref:VPLPA-CTERM sorting domain-containing protein n=1 Tax=Oceanicoccus sp. KOV_DT_Chl TaxID=1904639 RepID=UPI000C7CDCD2|nr:VPLPA-CTERM sorting domain-containing protein [Oceanicoccus sp. KOV_DT_Chl]